MQTSQSNQQLQQANNVSVFDMLVLGLAVAITLYLRLNLLNIPFDRDEGEYAYAGQQILQGNLPYDVIYNMKFPGVYYMYASVFAVFGESVAAIRLTGLCMHLATAFFLFGLCFIFIFQTNRYICCGNIFNYFTFFSG
jgi:predicted membrane-bound mannosyltransferase